jgi:hypothetical protein
MKITTLLFLTLFTFVPLKSYAWGRRGHSIVCQGAAYLIAGEPKAAFLRNHSFDLGYYCNVPDIIWKDNPETAKLEWFNHFMDQEMFDRYVRGSKVVNPYALDRLAFQKAFPQIPEKAGRSWWRIREIFDQMMDFKAKLSPPNLKKEDQFEYQGEWLLRAGVMGHYIGDLAQPLHVSENYNGEMTKQKGIHAFFEDEIVNDLFEADRENLEHDAFLAAEARWKKEHTGLAKKSVLELEQAITKESTETLPELLKLDRQVGRKDIAKVRKAYRPMIVARLAAGSLYLAELYRRGVGFDFNDERFFKYFGIPKYIYAPK